VLLLAVMAAVSGACATTTTQLGSVAPDAIRAEEVAQRELVLAELAKAQQRLDNIAYPLLAAATPMCSGKTGRRLGVRFRSIHDLTGPWAAAGRTALQLSDTVSVVAVTEGSPAAHAGLQRADRVLAIGGTSIPAGRGAAAEVGRALAAVGNEPVVLSVRRGDRVHEIAVRADTICNLGAIVIVEGDINAYADGENVIFPWAMMRFANDDELRAVVAHEIAHNAMGHIEARRQNAALGALFGAIADIALATQGYNSGGQNTANFMRAGAVAFSQDFEREADYVGMYIMARAGVPLNGGPNLWRQFAQINPSAIGYATTHPTTAERFVRLRAAIEEIEAKRDAGRELLPEMKARR
jgi:membrane-associated protease RseP (regulator of RpoE activity)